MDDAPLQLYCSGLAFAPKMSLIRRTFKHEFPGHTRMLLQNVEESWSAELQTLEGHSWYVNSVALSQNGQLLASGSDDGSVKLWDASAGGVVLRKTLKTLDKGNAVSGQRVECVAFSHDSQLLASSNNHFVNMWDTSTGALQKTLKCHDSGVLSLAFSCDRLMASASSDDTIRIWDTDSGILRHTLKGHSSTVMSVAFSHHGHLLASGSLDRTVRVWDVHTGILKQTLDHSDDVKGVAFSHGGQLLASASDDKTIKLWDTETGVLQQTLTGHSDRVQSVAFSPDDQLLASA